MKESTQKAGIGLRGRLKVEVIDHAGNVIQSRPWQPNLILDYGLNNLINYQIVELFEYAAGGTGTSATKETPDITNKYALTGSGDSRTLTLTPGTPSRPFDGTPVTGDIGKLVRITSPAGDGTYTEMIITAVTDATNATVRRAGSTKWPGALWSNKAVVFYSVHKSALDAEHAPDAPATTTRTNIYGAVPKDNSTVNAGAKRTMQRTFIFAPIPMTSEFTGGTDAAARYTLTVTPNPNRVKRIAGTRLFTDADIGKRISFSGTNHAEVLITGLVGGVSGDEVIIQADGGTAQIPAPGEMITLFGYREYGEIGFSKMNAPGTGLEPPGNINIRVRLEDAGGNPDPVRVPGPTGSQPSQQLRVVYEIEVTVSPKTVQSGAAQIDDPNHVMGGSKQGTWVVERLALSSVNPDGSTNKSFASLEPADPAALGISQTNAPLVAVGGTKLIDRSSGLQSVAMEGLPYLMDSFTREYQGTFGLNEAIGDTWYGLGIVDSDIFPFLFLFETQQTKTGAVALNVRFSKTWNRSFI